MLIDITRSMQPLKLLKQLTVDTKHSEKIDRYFKGIYLLEYNDINRGPSIYRREL